ncbi:DNAJ protein JJJ1 homolog [Lactuca sativa]|uniref:J domain-containing protein n=1 Tax=Lactuca sativa TaxID=4236 RepID=A0A9R1VR47_LACSA|nr:DNAJ protein JJJ1 homolog [Lactuca sativa]KAJ0209168.1 hypothetical protein LSAT_V11C400200920 [Lactuca sativa]
MTSPEKRCLYEVLGLQRDCTADEIRSAYRKLALQRHPDKLIKSGVSEAEATASFQELVNAYEVLSDVRERTWYDSHRSQILFSGSNPNNSSSGSAVVPDLLSFFSNSVYSGFSDKGKGFYKVYADVFDKIYRNELKFAKTLGLGNVVKEAPLMGNLDSPYAQVNAFYGYWLGFVTVMDFVWEDEYDANAGPNRKSRRMMEDENKKIRKKAKREYNETVRGLAEFVKKRDKRVIDMQMKRNEEIEKKKEEERARKKEMEREKAERARLYEEPDWAKMEDSDEVVVEEEEEEDERKNEFYCVVCGKKFKSDKQWKNHEQSKKHKEKVAELREAFEEEEEEEEEEEVTENKDDLQSEDIDDGEVIVDEVEELKEKFEEVIIEKEETAHDEEKDDDENSLEAMLSWNKNKKKPKKKVYVEVEEEEVDLMEYNNKKGRRKRGGKKDTATKPEDEEQQKIDKPEISGNADVDNKSDDDDDGSHIEKPSSSLSKPCVETETNVEEANEPNVKIKVVKQAPASKVINKKEGNSKGKNSTRGKKQKATSRNSGHECDTCGVNFDSRTKLHKHLSDEGHAAIKSR